MAADPKNSKLEKSLSKQNVISSDKYSKHADILSVFLSDDVLYSDDEIKKIISEKSGIKVVK